MIDFWRHIMSGKKGILWINYLKAWFAPPCSNWAPGSTLRD